MQSKMAKEKRLVLIIKFVIRGKEAQLTSQFTDSTPYNKKIQFPCIATSMTINNIKQDSQLFCKICSIDVALS